MTYGPTVEPMKPTAVTSQQIASGMIQCSRSMAEAAIEALLYPSPGEVRPGAQDTPDWDEVAKELRRKGVTKQLLWEEYQEDHGDRAYSYSRYCELYAHWKGDIEPVMRF